MNKLLHFLPFFLVLAFIVCDKNGSTGPDLKCSDPEDGALIRVNYPGEGDTFKVGDEIDIRYSIDVEQTP